MISLLVAFCFTLNVFASTGTIQQFERALDDYHYSLSVDWDQKDNKFHEQKTLELFNKIQDLMSKSGLTQSQIISLLEKKMHSKAEVEALNLKLALIGNSVSPQELAGMEA